MTRPKIPEKIKRAVRQRCHYGCIICGIPVFQYDHIEKYSVVKKHEEKNITLLCPTHHHQKTSGTLLHGVIHQYNLEPYNKKKLFTSPHGPFGIFMSTEPMSLLVGSNTYIFNFPTNKRAFDAIKFRGQTVVGIQNEKGFILLNLVMTNKTGDVILEVVAGEAKVATDVWDYRFEGNSIKINSASDNIEFEMNLEPNRVSICKGFFYARDRGLEILPNEIKTWPDKMRIASGTFKNCTIGLNVN